MITGGDALLQIGVSVTKPVHLDWLVDFGVRQTTVCGREIEIWGLNPQENQAVLSAWQPTFAVTIFQTTTFRSWSRAQD